MFAMELNMGPHNVGTVKTEHLAVKYAARMVLWIAFFWSWARPSIQLESQNTRNYSGKHIYGAIEGREIVFDFTKRLLNEEQAWKNVKIYSMELEKLNLAIQISNSVIFTAEK